MITLDYVGGGGVLGQDYAIKFCPAFPPIVCDDWGPSNPRPMFTPEIYS